MATATSLKELKTTTQYPALVANLDGTKKGDILRCLRDLDVVPYSSREIARRCKTSISYVRKLRSELARGQHSRTVDIPVSVPTPDPSPVPPLSDPHTSPVVRGATLAVMLIPYECDASCKPRAVVIGSATLEMDAWIKVARESGILFLERS